MEVAGRQDRGMEVVDEVVEVGGEADGEVGDGVVNKTSRNSRGKQLVMVVEDEGEAKATLLEVMEVVGHLHGKRLVRLVHRLPGRSRGQLLLQSWVWLMLHLLRRLGGEVW